MYSEQNKGVRSLVDYPHIHIHYLVDDDQMDRDGHSVAEIACHACDTAIQITFPVYDGETEIPELTTIRSIFEKEHADCKSDTDFASYCPGPLGTGVHISLLPKANRGMGKNRPGKVTLLTRSDG